MVRQELGMSCGAACARQLLLDAGINVPEARIRELAGFDPDQGITHDGVGEALNQLHAGERYRWQSVDPAQLPALAERVPFIAMLRTPSWHFVIVQAMTDTEVFIRDPAGVPANLLLGSEGVMTKETFMERWKEAVNLAIWRRR